MIASHANRAYDDFLLGIGEGSGSGSLPGFPIPKPMDGKSGRGTGTVKTIHGKQARHACNIRGEEGKEHGTRAGDGRSACQVSLIDQIKSPDVHAGQLRVQATAYGG